MNKFRKFFMIAVMLSFLCPTIVTDAAVKNDTVVLGGIPFGLTMYTSGVIVINVDESYSSPAQEAGIKENDIITRANGEEISTNEELQEIISASQGEDIELSVTRGKSPISVTITPKENDDGEYTVGMWIRDSTAGLGTVTYFDESTCSFGALGHGINDKDTGMLLPLRDGQIVTAEITSATKAKKGVAGGLNGCMTNDLIGEITVNNGYGIFGRYDNLIGATRIQCAEDSEISTGNAYIYCTVDDTGVKEYEVEIESLNMSDTTGQNMVIKVTDERLLEVTGGIVQGMSGSPIVQDGQLIGAVTHVFVNSPETGYGISIGNMRQSYEKYGGY